MNKLTQWNSNQEKSDLSNEYCSKVELQQNQIKKGETRNKELSDSLAELQHKYQTVQQENKALLSTKNQQLEGIHPLQINEPTETYSQTNLNLNRDSPFAITAGRGSESEIFKGTAFSHYHDNSYQQCR